MPVGNFRRGDTYTNSQCQCCVQKRPEVAVFFTQTAQMNINCVPIWIPQYPPVGSPGLISRSQAEVTMLDTRSGALFALLGMPY